MTRRVSTLVMLLAVVMVAMAQPALASVSSTPDKTATPNGVVFDIEQVGSLTIIAGVFTRVGGQVRNRVAAIRPDGTVDPTFKPNVNGTVYAVESDGTRVFLGGLFTSVNGVTRNRLAAVDLTGQTITSWDANVSGTTNPHVRSLDVAARRLYVGGRYTTIDGAKLRYLAAVDTVTGAVVPEFTPQPDNRLTEVKISPDANKVYAGGYFNTIGGQSRTSHFAELSPTGDATSWNPSGLGTTYVSTVGLSVDGQTVYIANGRNYLFAYSRGANTPQWRLETAGDTQAIAASSSQIYFGGHWPRMYTPNADRQYLASVTPNGTLTSWNPQLGPTDPKRAGEVWDIELTATHAHVGGKFSTIGGTSRPKYARFAGAP